jgi:hypothetical protein
LEEIIFAKSRGGKGLIFNHPLVVLNTLRNGPGDALIEILSNQAEHFIGTNNNRITESRRFSHSPIKETPHVHFDNFDDAQRARAGFLDQPKDF